MSWFVKEEDQKTSTSDVLWCVPSVEYNVTLIMNSLHNNVARGNILYGHIQELKFFLSVSV
jgi:hypothetical protein